MTGKQQGVLWAGLLLIGVRFFATGQFKPIWETITNPDYAGSGASDVGSIIQQGVGVVLKHLPELTPQPNSPQTPGNPQGGGHASIPV